MLVIFLPLAIGIVLAVTIGGWVSVVIILVWWAGLAVALAVGLRIGLRSWYSVRSLIDTAGRLADGDYTARAKPVGRAPVQQVVHSFNRMAERLEGTETERRRLLADVGHELRTPLTIIRGELEAMADGVRAPDEATLRRLLEDIDVMDRLLDDLATLSTAEAGMLAIHREPTEIVGLINGVIDGLQPKATDLGVIVELEPADLEAVIGADDGTGTQPVIEADVDPIRIREIVANIVTNALRATPAGGRVTIIPQRRDQHVTITVADTGHGMAPDEVERAFDRFNKGPGSSGSGLGLTISRNLAMAHGGDITLTSEEGTGTTVHVSLPVEPPIIPEA